MGNAGFLSSTGGPVCLASGLMGRAEADQALGLGFWVLGFRG